MTKWTIPNLEAPQVRASTSPHNELLCRLEALSLQAETSDRWTDEDRLMSASGVADTVLEAVDCIEALQDRLDKVSQREAEGFVDELLAEVQGLRSLVRVYMGLAEKARAGRDQ